MGARKGVVAGVAGVVAAITMLIGAAQASALVFWTNTGVNSDGTSIGRADLDGGNADNFFIGGQDHPCGVAVDDEHIYWATRGDFPVGGIARADLDGSNVDPHFIDAGFSPCGVAVDDEHVYWADYDNGGGDTIGRADIDGGNPDPDFITTATGASVCGLAVDASHIYWGTTYSTGDIGRAKLDGTAIDNHFVEEAEHSCGVAVNASHLYWGDVSQYSGQGSVGRANLDGTGADIDFIPNSAGVGSPCGIAVDAEHLYWGDRAAMTGNGVIGRASLDGSNVDASFITTAVASCGVAVNDLVSPPPVPNNFKIGKLTRNKRQGTAALAIRIPAAGRVVLRGNGVKRLVKVATEARRLRLKVRAGGRKARTLRKRGQVTVRAKITYRPEGGEARTMVKRVKLVKKAKRKRAGTRGGQR